MGLWGQCHSCFEILVCDHGATSFVLPSCRGLAARVNWPNAMVLKMVRSRVARQLGSIFEALRLAYWHMPKQENCRFLGHWCSRLLHGSQSWPWAASHSVLMQFSSRLYLKGFDMLYQYLTSIPRVERKCVDKDHLIDASDKTPTLQYYYCRTKLCPYVMALLLIRESSLDLLLIEEWRQEPREPRLINLPRASMPLSFCTPTC
ncbi:hypothetical protein VNO77_34461 [Canavalia gladiata]|uniref:Uncharacterized protein n=1 Tax=Canavalia gladiata TaxID=3824 RepID=A0AAN9KHK5_CANGL